MRWSWKKPKIIDKYVDNYKQWLKVNRWWFQTVVIGLLTAVLIVFFWKNNWAPWTDFRGKKLWDWLELLGVPISLAILGAWLQSSQQKQVEKATAAQREADAEENREDVLQVYFDRMSALLIEKNLIGIVNQKAKNDTTAQQIEILETSLDIIRARTLSLLRRFEKDRERQRNVIQFLAEAEILNVHKLNLSLAGANLKKAELKDIQLSETNLRDIDLSGANLSWADLTRAQLENTQLSKTNLSFACLVKANLKKAKLHNALLHDAFLEGTNLLQADLSGAFLHDAFLRNARLLEANLLQADLSGAFLHDTDLKLANLQRANLHEAFLINAILWETVFKEAVLTKTIILATDLRKAQGFTQDQLECNSAPLICNSPLPSSIKINKDRDCDQIADVLNQRIPAVFSLKDAEVLVNELKQKTWD